MMVISLRRYRNAAVVKYKEFREQQWEVKLCNITFLNLSNHIDLTRQDKAVLNIANGNILRSN